MAFVLISVLLQARSIRFVSREEIKSRRLRAFMLLLLIILALNVLVQEIQLKAVAGGKDYPLTGTVPLAQNPVGFGKALSGERELFSHLDGSGIVVHSYNLQVYRVSAAHCLIRTGE